MNFGGMEKMIQGLVKTALKDPKKRQYIENVLMSSADTAVLQKYVNMKLYGKYVEDGEVKDLDEPGDIPQILERLDRLEEKVDKLIALLEKEE